MLMRSQSAVYFGSGLKILWTEIAIFGPGGQSERAADANSVSELEGFVPDILFSNEIFRNRPAART